MTVPASHAAVVDVEPENMRPNCFLDSVVADLG